MTEQNLRIGNCLDVLKDIESESVDVCVTSPPYWGLRDYKSEPVIWGGFSECDHKWDYHAGYKDDDNVQYSYCLKCGAWKGQLGLEPTPYEYIEHLLLIFDEVKRVLKPTGSCWVNVGDTYSGSKYGDSRHGKEIKNKSLIQIPSRFAIGMTDHGWILRNECIWHKPNVMPSSVKDRFTVDFEKFYFFTKEPTYYFKQQLESIKECSIARSKYSFKSKKANLNPNNDGGINLTIMGNRFVNEEGRNKRTVWTIPTSGSKEHHSAMFPISLIDIPIKSCCPINGIVLDPFCGSGTTLEYCRKHDLNGIGIEINPSFKEIIDRRSMANICKLEGWE